MFDFWHIILGISPFIGAILFLVLIVYLIYRRGREKDDETFEKRDN